MAVTHREQQMLDLSEEGLSADAIAERMGIKTDSVKRTLTLLSGAGSNRECDAIRRGSAQLLAAIERERAASCVRAR